MNILSIRAYVEETICLASAHKGQQSYCLPKKKHRFCQYDYRRSHLLKNGKVPFIGPDTLPSQPGGLRQLLVHAPKGKETRISFVTRLPDCRTMRPTSLECNSRTPLHISTNIGVDVRYRASDGSARVMTVDKKVSIASVSHHCVSEGGLLTNFSP